MISYQSLLLSTIVLNDIYKYTRYTIYFIRNITSSYVVSSCQLVHNSLAAYAVATVTD